MGNQNWVSLLTSGQVNGPALTAAARASCLPTTALALVPGTGPGQINIGTAFRISMSGLISSVIAAPGTARFDVTFGGVIVFDSLAILLDTVAAHANVLWKLEILLTCRAIGNGTNANFMGSGMWTCEDILGVPAAAPKGVLTAMLPWNSPPAVGAGFDSTTSNAINVFFTQTVATGSLTVQQALIEQLN